MNSLKSASEDGASSNRVGKDFTRLGSGRGVLFKKSARDSLLSFATG